MEKEREGERLIMERKTERGQSLTALKGQKVASVEDRKENTDTHTNCRPFTLCFILH